MFVQTQNEWKEALYQWNGANQELVLEKELLRALIFLQAPEANKIALHWLETLSDKKDEPAKASEPEKR